MKTKYSITFAAMILRSFVLIFTVCIVCSCYGQNEWGMDITYKNGFLAAHHSNLAHIPKQNVSAFEINWWVDLEEGEGFRRNYTTPRIGFTALFTQTSNEQLLGHAAGILANSELPFKRTDRFFFNSRVALGVGYVSKVFDQHNNPSSFAVSTQFNAMIILGLKTGFFFGKNRVSVGADLTHFSNAAWKVPNLGLNYMFLNLGFSRSLGSLKNVRSGAAKVSHAKFQSRLYLIGGGKEIAPTGGRRYPIFSLYANLQKSTGPKGGAELGMDLIYRTSTMDYRPEFSKEKMDLIQVGLFLGYNLKFDRLSTVMGMGYYLRDFFNPDGAFYHRLGLRYQFTNRLSGCIVLKSNWGKADYMEYGIAYKLFQK